MQFSIISDGTNNFAILFVILDNVKALRDVWLVGDAFLRELWPNILGTKSKAALDHTSKPYIFEFFNVHPLYAAGAASGSRSILSRMFNEIVEN